MAEKKNSSWKTWSDFYIIVSYFQEIFGFCLLIFLQFSGPSCSKVDKAMSFPNTYALDGDLSIGKCYNYIQHLNNRDLELTCPLLVLPQLQE